MTVDVSHIISNTSRLRHGPWWLVSCKLPRTPLNGWAGYNDLFSAGCSTDHTTATLRAFGEAIERYSATQAWDVSEDTNKIAVSSGPLAEALPRCSIDELQRLGIDGSVFDEVVSHSVVTDLTNNSEVLIPSGFVHLGLHGSPESVWSRPNSNGLASGVNLTSAIYRGICEIIERDAFATRWLCFSAPPQVIFSEFDCGIELRFCLAYLRKEEVEVKFFYLTIDVSICVIACVLISRVYPNFVIGLGTSAEPLVAMQKSLDEAVSARVGIMLNFGRSTKDYDWGFDQSGIPTKVYRFSDHALFYANGDYKSTIERVFQLDEGGEKIDLANLQSISFLREPLDQGQLRNLVDILASYGLSIFSRDLSTSDIGENWHVVRVFIPEAMPFSEGTSVRWLGTRRLVDYATSLGRPTTELNLLPHPFA